MRELFQPLIADWFESRFREPTEPQRRGWPAIAGGRDTLIAAPTGSGKTLAAFLACIDDLSKRQLEERTYILYVSPLKALANDIQRNLERPLAELSALAVERGVAFPRITTGVRSGDTPMAERARMAKRPPHILITTPESLYILLTSKSGQLGLGGVRAVIVNEIHAVAADKRGAHLALSLERLDALVLAGGGARPTRIGLSATQTPIEEVARFLCGTRPLPLIIDVGHRREIDLAIEVPRQDELGAVATHEMWGEIYDRVAELVQTHRTTIIFVNTRRLVERMAFHLAERLGEDKVCAHHGSLSRKTRHDTEQKLKANQVPCVVATASLELGIDVGDVELVVQVGSPRSIATLLQRIGRSGHSLGATPKGRLFALTRDQLCECAALVRAVRAGRLDKLSVRKGPLDVLAQQIVATAAASEDGVGEDELRDLVKRTYSYADLAEADFQAVLTMLSDGIATQRGRRSALLHRDAVNGRLRGRRAARLSAMTSGGAIPDNAAYSVVAEPEGMPVGTLDEDFAIESMAGDIFLLGNTSWKIRRVEAGIVRVEDAHGQPPTIPFWLGEAPARTSELSEEVAALREDFETRLAAGDALPAIAEALGQSAAMSPAAATQLVAYLAAARQALGALPTHKTFVAERFFDESGGMQLLIHAPLGGRINRAWGLALRKRFCQTFDFELQAAATDDGLLLSLGPNHSFPLASVFEFLRANSVEAVLTQALLAAPMWGVRWRWNVTRSLAVLRFMRGKKVPAPLVRMRSDDLMAAVFPHAQACPENLSGPIELPDHPLVNETLRDCLTEAMDIVGLRRVLDGMASGMIRVLARDTTEPSPLGHEILNANPYAFLDDAPLEERRSRAVSLRRSLPAAGEMGALDAEAIASVAEEAAPSARDPDELHDVLLSLIVMPARDDGEWPGFLQTLIGAGRAARVTAGGRVLWVAAERAHWALAALPGAVCQPRLGPVRGAAAALEPADAVRAIVRGHLEVSAPTTAHALADRLGLEPAAVDAAMLALEGEGAVLRGQFTAGVQELEWSDRRILARIHSRTLRRLRREVEPVNAADFMRFLLRWQHVWPGTQLAGPSGVHAVIEQLQGVELAAGAWEDEALAARVLGYQPGWLDQACYAGEVVWGRRTMREASEGASPTRAAPIALMLRRDLPWLLPGGETTGLGEAATEVLGHLVTRGASFLPDIALALRRPAGDIEDALWELVTAGIVTADGFASLRHLMDRSKLRGRLDNPTPARVAMRMLARRQPALDRPAAAGRWSLLRDAAPPEPADPAEVLAAVAVQLLSRYGVIFRDLLAREPAAPPWRELLGVYRRLEARGEIRGGRFVQGYVGEQYALPEAVTDLRALRRERPDPALPELLRVGATDPLNLVGILSPGPRVPAVLGNAVLYRDGVPIASREAGELIVRRELGPEVQLTRELDYQVALSAAGA